MKNETKHVQCPNCGADIDVNEILYRQLKSEFDKKYSDFKNEKKEVERMKLHLKESIEKSVNQKLISEKAKIEQKLKGKFESESKEKLNILLLKEKTKIQKEIENKSQLKISEKEHVINQLKKQLTIAQRQILQGSTQTQGECYEIEMEKSLKAAFPFDEISEVAKGTNGADILLNVRNVNQQPCGLIAIECKQTKSFSPLWIDKLKSDQRRHKADLAILVSEILPKDMKTFGFKDGVWICTFQEIVPLIFVLRESILKIHEVRATNDNKSGKLSLLYAFLTGSEFAGQIQTIVEGFTKLKSNLEQEKKAMYKVWTEREKSIDTVAQTTVEMYSSIKGIAGNAVKRIAALELPLHENSSSK